MINKRFFWFLFFILMSISFIFLNNYSYNKLYFILLSILCNGYFLVSFSKSIHLFHLFNSFFLWMGFWIKIIIVYLFFDLSFAELDNDIYSVSKNFNKNFDKAILVSSVGTLGFFLSAIINYFYFPFNYKKRKIFDDTRLISFFNNHMNLILISFVLLILIINYLNFDHLIYQKGLIGNKDINKIISSIFKWLLIFGLSSFSAIIIYNSLTNNKISIKILIVAVFENFITSVSLLSRGMFVNFMAILFGIIKYNQFIKFKYFNKFLIKLLFIFAILFISSLVIVQDLRDQIYFDKKVELNSTKNKNIKKLSKDKSFKLEKISADLGEFSDHLYQRYIRQIFLLISHRFVGFDAVLAVTIYDNKGFDLFFSTFTEEEMIDSFSTVIKKEDYINTQSSKDNTKFIKVPGIIAFLFYSGSLIFVFFICLMLGLIFIFFEKFIIRFSNENIIFGSLISQVLAYRLSNFGFMPQNTYLLIITILFNLFLIYLIYFYFTKILKK